MSRSAVLAVLGPRHVLGPNLKEPLALQKKLRVRGGVTLEDDAARERTRMRSPETGHTVVTIDRLELARTTRPWVLGISAADLVRLDPQSPTVLEGIADAMPLGSSVYAVRAVPNNPEKFLVNVGINSVSVQPPVTMPEDPDKAGWFLDSITLPPGVIARIVWDHASYGYRIQGGAKTYVTYQGQYVVHNGQRIYVRT